MAIDLKLTPSEKKQMDKFTKDTPRGKPMTKEKPLERSGRTLPIRGQK